MTACPSAQQPQRPNHEIFFLDAMTHSTGMSAGDIDTSTVKKVPPVVLLRAAANAGPFQGKVTPKYFSPQNKIPQKTIAHGRTAARTFFRVMHRNDHKTLCFNLTMRCLVRVGHFLPVWAIHAWNAKNGRQCDNQRSVAARGHFFFACRSCGTVQVVAWRGNHPAPRKLP